ncbi:hypothetical protein SAMN05443247_09956 [Bradyrhizobium erythrophlei]|nr:hypothetical protein SAMN05443247_09956 [Bradyrhizobium erythrophlei]
MHARYTQEATAIPLVSSKALVNGRSMKVVNIRSTKMMKKFSKFPCDYGERGCAKQLSIKVQDSSPTVIASQRVARMRAR